MPRKPLIRSQVLPYHVTARCNNREAYPCGIEMAWEVLADHCFQISVLFGAKVHAFVVMPNHFHLLLSTPHEDLGVVMDHFMGSSTRAMNLKSGRTGRIFGSRYHWSLIDSPLYFAHAYKYILRNPVKSALCARPQDYVFSSLFGLLGHGKLEFPICFPYRADSFLYIPEGVEAQLTWLEQSYEAEHELAIRRGLRRSRFEPPAWGWKPTLDTLRSKLV